MGRAMKPLPDATARFAALTAIDRSLLVEAGAGSGKTALMAGRVAVLFANGVQPKHVAAVTFTEFAASELLQRITGFAVALARGEVPHELELAFPSGICAEQQAQAQRACNAIDQLTCTTIHGLAQRLIKPYPAEADMDPGAEIIDPAEADLAFTELYEAWLKKHLAGNDEHGLLAELVLADEQNALKLLNELAQFLRRNRDAKPAGGRWSRAVADQFIAAANAFARGLDRWDFREEKTDEVGAAFVSLVELLGPSLQDDNPSNRALVAALQLPRSEACFTQNGRRALRVRVAWQRAAAAAGRSKANAEQACDAATSDYESCHDALEALLSEAAAELLARLAVEMDELMRDWRAYKRAAALLDFDDLLYTARDLLTRHEEIRQALAKRFHHVLVDEFQDTDPLQIEIIWLLCGEACEQSTVNMLGRALRPGALFLVGDPKQAIYRFRGADVNAYMMARTAIGKTDLLKIIANFRSVDPILSFVNHRFEKVLSEAAGQPGFSELSSIHRGMTGPFSVAALDIPEPGEASEKPNAAMLRDAEAECVAEACSRLIGNAMTRDEHAEGGKRPCRPGDIALLAPTGTDLWRFEQALEDRGISVSTQAGKGFFRRQEVADLIALTRMLADARDTLALGALLRGPLVGLTEGELLDIADALPPDPNRPDRLPCLDLRTDSTVIQHALGRSVLEALQSLHRRARSTTPYALLADAIAALNVRPQLRQRFRGGSERAIANVDLFLEMARAYDVRGLRAFARDMRSNWTDAVRQVEGRPDAEENAVTLVTVHAAKGLEWPVVIPINMTGRPHAETGVMQDRRLSVFSTRVLGAEPAGYAALKEHNVREDARERVRLWYVATTRARDFLILPRHSAELSDTCWANIVDLQLDELPRLDLAKLGDEKISEPDGAQNAQTPEIFAAEAARITRAMHKLDWTRPSRMELGEGPPSIPVPLFDSADDAQLATEIPVPSVAGSSQRGILLHKLMEEVLTGETSVTPAELRRRAEELIGQLGLESEIDPARGISPVELAATVERTLGLPEVTQLRERLVPEHTVFGRETTPVGEILISGVADAVALDAEGGIDTIIDWKSDVDPSQSTLIHYFKQLDEYRRHTGAKRALLVLMTAGKVMEARAPRVTLAM
jgi:ATP-dependent exoDNAse (exonuclease V) beta subunit